MKNNRSSIKWIYLLSKRVLPLIITVSLFNIFASIIYLLLANISKTIIDNAHGYDHSILFGSIFLFALIILQLIFNSTASMISVRASNNMSIALKNSLFSAIMRKKYSVISEYHSGNLLNRFTSDVDQVVSGCVNIIPNLLSMLTKIIAGIAALCIENYVFAFVVLIVGFLFPLIGRLLSKRYKALHKLVQQTEGESRSFLQECFANIVVIKTFSGEAALNKKFNEFLFKNKKLRIKRNYFSIIISASLYLCFTLGYYGVLVWGAVAVSDKAITMGTLIYFLQLISMLRTPLQNISGIIPSYYSMIASAERLIELENLEQEQAPSTSTKIPEFEKIIAENLAFAYDDEIVLKNCSFSIKKQTITAITGESGSGKSTLFKLLLGLYTLTGGTLTLDGKIPLNETTRNLFSYVPQGNMVISGTIRENITLNDSNANDEDIIKAAKAAAIYDFISSLPDGFDTEISERGLGLSEGQIQRIAIARALLFDAPIILLDEATSALDEETETQLLNNLKQFTDKTIIFITHRNTSLSACDKILHIENGSFISKK